MDENNLTIEYLNELQKIAEALDRLELRIDKHFNKLLVARAEESNFVTRAEAAKYLGLSERHFDRRAKEWHFWRYRNYDGTGLRYNKVDLRLSKDELSDKWIKGILSKQIDANCNVVRKENPLTKGKNSKMLKEILNSSKNEKH